MPRLLRDCNQTFIIELFRGRSLVHFVIMENLEVRLKKWSYSRLIDHPGAAAGKALFDDRFKPVALTNYPLERAIEHFLDPGFSRVHENARRALEALRNNRVLSEAEMAEDNSEIVTTPIKTCGDIEKQPGVADMSEVEISPDLKHYKKTTAASGRKSYDVGDDIAKLLRGKELAEVYELAAKKLDCSVRSLKEKYGHLNVGQQRMNLGNRLRGLAKTKAKKSA